MSMSPAMVTLLVAATAITGVLAIYQVASDLFLRDRSRVNDRVDHEFLKKRRDQAKKSPLFKNLGITAAEAMEHDEGKATIQQRFAAMIDQSGMDVTPARLLGISGVGALVLGMLAFLPHQNLIHVLVASAIGGLVPVWVVKRRRDKRVEKLRGQLPDAFDLMARVIRAGQTLGQSLMAVADEFPQPIAMEFAFCYEQQNLGLPPEVTFRDLARRNGVIELKIFVLAVLVQQQTGGNLADLLSKLALVVRERYIIRGTIRSLTAEGRLQGWVLAGLPPLMFLMLLVMNPVYATAHFQHPNLLLGTFGFEFLGILWIRKIVNFEF